MMTVLDGLDALEDGINSSELEGDGEGLEGGLEEECDINELRSDPNNNKEEVYNDNDDSTTWLLHLICLICLIWVVYLCLWLI